MLLERRQWLLACSCILMFLVSSKLSATSEREAVIRPQMHFTPPAQWMNDPNGMVFYNGEYHMFYQHYPEGLVWGPMHWGHAVSTDLLEWQHLPIALYPDDFGMIFSGSVVVDQANTSGLGTESKSAMVALFTYHDEEAKKAGSKTFQSQGLAYSLDKGRTWEKYSNNPVLPNPDLIDFRDPKVSWHAPTERWVMVVTQGDVIGFYSSPDLLSWRHESNFGKGLGAHGGVWECPDLIRVGDHYVLIVSLVPGGPNGGSATQYFVGDFDGTKFIPLKQHLDNPQKALWLDWGPDNYAGVTFSGTEKVRDLPVFIGWANNWSYATEIPATTWRSMMTLPRELFLYSNAEGVALGNRPVKEVNIAFSRQETLVLEDDGILLPDVSPVYVSMVMPESRREINIALYNEQGEKIVFYFDREKNIVVIDRASSGNVDYIEDVSLVASARHAYSGSTTIDLVYDGNLIELFLDGGKTSMTIQVFPGQRFNRLSKGNTKILSIKEAVLK